MPVPANRQLYIEQGPVIEGFQAMTRGPDPDVTLQDVWDLMEFGMPETAATLAERLPCHPDTVYNRLVDLGEEGYVKSKDASARAKVWWKPTHNPGIDPDEINIDTRSEKDPKIVTVLAEAKQSGEPMTSTEISEEIGDTKDITYNRLRKLEERGWVQSLKAGSTGKVWWLADVDTGGDGGQTSLSLSPALKTELKRIRDEYPEPQNLREAVIFVMKYPDVTRYQLEGNEEDLEPIKVSESTRDYLRSLRDDGDYPDYEAVIRDNAEIARREANINHVERTPPAERSVATGTEDI